ncbi:MAG TPA: flagellar biosynthesis protein FlhF [Bacilli bacterium]
MRVKRYVVDSMPDALKKIRSDLGKDAVILNTKEIRVGGFLGLFTKKRIEVIAAIESANQADNPAVKEAMGNPSPVNLVKSEAAVALNAAQASVGILVREPVQAMIAAEQAKPTKSNDALLLEEMKQMKDIVYKLSINNKDIPKASPFFEKLEMRLYEHEVDPRLVKLILQNAMAEIQGPVEEVTEDQARGLIKNQLALILKSDGTKGILPDTRIVHLVGPTGVGKTTTIAKLAAEQVLKNNRKVGLITSDTYRIAAVEQLKTYATILNVPLEVVFSPQDLAKALKQLADRDIIFMDTAGRNYRNEMYVSELNSLLQSKGNSETYLVLSLTTKYKDMKVITKNFSKFKVDKVLFTKMDETGTFGSIINLTHDFSLKLGYITNGQNVPDDIVELNEDLIIERILEEAYPDE